MGCCAYCEKDEEQNYKRIIESKKYILNVTEWISLFLNELFPGIWNVKCLRQGWENRGEEFNGRGCFLPLIINSGTRDNPKIILSIMTNESRQYFTRIVMYRLCRNFVSLNAPRLNYCICWQTNLVPPNVCYLQGISEWSTFNRVSWPNFKSVPPSRPLSSRA